MDDLKPKSSSSSDLKEKFQEIIVEFAAQIEELCGIAPGTNDCEPEVEKAVNRLIDEVSNTMLLDPH